MTTTLRSHEQMAQVFQALSDPTRLQILTLLRRDERCVCELTDALAAAQSRLSFHLKALKDAGLLLDRKEGRWVYYRLEPSAVEEYGALFDLLPRQLPKGKRGECCG